jgi:hypothetical protein
MRVHSLRCYLFEEGDGGIKRIPWRVFEGLVFGKDAMPRYANTARRFATVIVDNHRGLIDRVFDPKKMVQPRLASEAPPTGAA